MSIETPALDRDYAAAFPRSRELFAEALSRLPSGITHDARWMDPFPVFVERAQGAYKWTVDGRRLIDYWMGHGALLRSEEHTSELQSRENLVCRLLLEKKKRIVKLGM